MISGGSYQLIYDLWPNKTEECYFNQMHLEHGKQTMIIFFFMWITRNCMAVLHCITTKGVVKLQRDPYLYVTPNYRLLRKKYGCNI